MTLRLAASSMLAPGETPAEQLSFLHRCGFEGVELRLGAQEAQLAGYLEDLQRALDDTGMRVCLLIVPQPSFGLPFDSREAMEAKLATLIHNLRIAGTLGAASLFCPEYRAQQPLPLWQPPPRMTGKERELLLELLSRAAEIAEEVGGTIAVEALNRYESHLLHRLASVAEICQQVGSPRVGILADFFHMNIEERDIAESLSAAMPFIRHVQLGDSNRLLPGQGHLDFRPGFRALLQGGYDGYMALECRAEGPLEEALRRCVEFLQRELDAVSAG